MNRPNFNTLRQNLPLLGEITVYAFSSNKTYLKYVLIYFLPVFKRKITLRFVIILLRGLSNKNKKLQLAERALHVHRACIQIS